MRALLVIASPSPESFSHSMAKVAAEVLHAREYEGTTIFMVSILTRFKQPGKLAIGGRRVNSWSVIAANWPTPT
jgi:hypothetical protein